jgi:hypothetical protein
MNFFHDVLSPLERPPIPQFLKASQGTLWPEEQDLSVLRPSEFLLTPGGDDEAWRLKHTRLVGSSMERLHGAYVSETGNGVQRFVEGSQSQSSLSQVVDALNFVPRKLTFETLTLPYNYEVSGALSSAVLQRLHGLSFVDSGAESLEDMYVIENRAAVTRFIEKNRLRGLLSQAVDALNGAFGKGAIKTLKLLCDDEGSETLFCMIMTGGEMERAILALRDFDERWWLAHCGLVAGKLNFDFELV